MTIIQPHKKFNTTFYTGGVILLIVFSAIWAIYLYNGIVNMRHELSVQRKRLESLGVENAELRNDVLRVVNSETMESLAQQLNLTKERQPRYFSTTQWPLASHF